jgi:hypothetical protein
MCHYLSLNNAVPDAFSCMCRGQQVPAQRRRASVASKLPQGSCISREGLSYDSGLCGQAARPWRPQCLWPCVKGLPCRKNDYAWMAEQRGSMKYLPGCASRKCARCREYIDAAPLFQDTSGITVPVGRREYVNCSMPQKCSGSSTASRSCTVRGGMDAQRNASMRCSECAIGT